MTSRCARDPRPTAPTGALRSPRLAGLVASATLVALASLAAPAAAQDEPAAPAAASDGDAQRAQALFGRLRALYMVAAERPSTDGVRAAAGDPGAVAKARAEFVARKKEWEQSLAAIPRLAEEYLSLAGDAADLSAYYFDGFARAARASVAAKTDVEGLLQGAVESLEIYLDRAPRDGTYRSDAERDATYALVRLAKGDGLAIVDAVPHANAGVRGFLAEGRVADAGRLAHLIMNSLVAAGRPADAAKLANGWDVEKADFGASTGSVRTLARRARLRPGEKMVALPELASYTGAPMPWKELAGKAFVLHFFSTVVSTSAREVETILVPLKKEWGHRGLHFVGCSTDRAMTGEEFDREKAKWKEWDETKIIRDGRLTSVREWAEQRDIDWPWYWDGKWMHNELVKATGAPVSGPFAVLVNGDGVITWCGAPFDGLKEAVAEVMTK